MLHNNNHQRSLSHCNVYLTLGSGGNNLYHDLILNLGSKNPELKKAACRIFRTYGTNIRTYGTNNALMGIILLHPAILDKIRDIQNRSVLTNQQSAAINYSTNFKELSRKAKYMCLIFNSSS